jgi:cobalamin biosynthesis protein CobD/CbiB
MNAFFIVFVVFFVLAVAAVCAAVSMRMVRTFDSNVGPRFPHRRLRRSPR